MSTLAIILNLNATKAEVLLFFSVALLGSVLEAFSMLTGAWAYAHQHILNIPIWLPLYWGIGGILIKDTYLTLKVLFK